SNCFLPESDDGALAVRGPFPDTTGLVPYDDYIVFHPGASVPARQMTASRSREVVKALVGDGHRVVVTGSSQDRELTRHVAGVSALDVAGRTDLKSLAGI